MEANEIVNELATKVKIPKGIKEAIFEKLFKNLCVAIVIVLYLIFVNMGYIKLNAEVFELDLHMFAGILIILTVMTFESAYRKGSSEMGIHGAELLVLSVITLFMPYIYFHRGTVLKFLYGLTSIYIVVYFLIKCIVIYIVEANKYKSGLSDIKEIIDDEEETYLYEQNKRKFNYVEEEEVRTVKEKLEKNVTKKTKTKAKETKKNKKEKVKDIEQKEEVKEDAKVKEEPTEKKNKKKTATKKKTTKKTTKKKGE